MSAITLKADFSNVDDVQEPGADEAEIRVTYTAELVVWHYTESIASVELSAGDTQSVDTTASCSVEATLAVGGVASSASLELTEAAMTIVASEHSSGSVSLAQQAATSAGAITLNNSCSTSVQFVVKLSYAPSATYTVASGAALPVYLSNVWKVTGEIKAKSQINNEPSNTSSSTLTAVTFTNPNAMVLVTESNKGDWSLQVE